MENSGWFWSIFAWGMFSSLTTGIVAVATNLYYKPSGVKTGIICGIAFCFGVVATRIQLF